MTNLLQSSCIMLNKILSSEFSSEFYKTIWSDASHIYISSPMLGEPTCMFSALLNLSSIVYNSIPYL